MAPPGKGTGASETSYSRMSDDELLLLADQKDALKDVARQALAAELRKRRMNFVAPTVAEAILGAAIASAQKVEQEFWAKASKPGKFKDEHFQDIVTEFVYVFFHLCDRDALNAISDRQKPGTFLDSALYYIQQFGKTQCMTDDHPVPTFTERKEWIEPRLLVVRQGMDLLNDRQVEYSSLGLFASQGESLLKRTVFGEFGNYVTKICDQYEHDPSMQAKAALFACDGYIALGPVFMKMHEPPRKSAGFFRRLFR
jgi:hypothetical protein